MVWLKVPGSDSSKLSVPRPNSAILYCIELPFICIITGLVCTDINHINALSFLEYLTRNVVSMLSNYVSAVKAKSIMFGENYKVWDHPNINTLSRLQRLIILSPLRGRTSWTYTRQKLVKFCDQYYMGSVFKAICLFFSVFFVYQT